MLQAELKQEKKGYHSKALLLILVAACLLIYGNTLNNGYAMDDVAVVTKNTYVQQGASAIPTLLHTPYLRGFKLSMGEVAASNDLYRPVSLVTFALEKELFDSSAAVSHMINVLLYAVCVCLLFVFLRRLLGYERTAIAFVTALLFAVHPIHTEVVANIKSRDELLCFLFAFAALIFYCKYATKGKGWQLVTGTGLYFLSLLSKETSATFIVIVPLIFFFYNDCSRKRGAYITATTALAFVGFMILRQAVLAHYNANHHDIAFIDNPLTGAPSVASRYATALLVLGWYLKLLLLPYPLLSDYTFNTIPFAGFANAAVLLSALAYMVIAAIAFFRLKRKKDVIAFGILFFLVTLVLFSNLIFFVGSMMAERFLFFPSVGFCLVAASMLAGKRHPTGRLSKVATALLVIVCLVYSSIATSRNTNWKSNMALFTADIDNAPENARLWFSLGYEKATNMLEHDKGEQARLIGEGIADMQKAVSIYPNYANAHNVLGSLFVKMQQYDSAQVHATTAATLNPADPAILSALGYVYFVKQQYHETIRLCHQALRYEPMNAAIWDNIAICYLQLQRYDSVIFASRRALELKPGNTLTLQNMAQAFDKLGVRDSAKKYQQ